MNRLARDTEREMVRVRLLADLFDAIADDDRRPDDNEHDADVISMDAHYGDDGG